MQTIHIFGADDHHLYRRITDKETEDIKIRSQNPSAFDMRSLCHAAEFTLQLKLQHRKVIHQEDIISNGC